MQKNTIITMGVILVTILTALVFAGHLLRQEVAAQEPPINQVDEDLEKQIQMAQNTANYASNEANDIINVYLDQMQSLTNKLLG